jgi:predicted O-linked N-acetylglucosamine transferase (SPINDLY family)
VTKRNTLQGIPAELAELLVESRWEEALAPSQRLVAGIPSDPRLWFIHGVLLRHASLLDEAIDAQQRSISLGFEGIGPYRELFTLLAQRGRIDEALACWRLAFNRGYSTRRFFSMALAASLHDPDATADDLLQSHLSWAALYARPDPGVTPLQITPFDGSRPMRVGYVCSFWEAPEVRFRLLPVLKRHDPRRVNAYLYVGAPLHMGNAWRELYEPSAVAVREVHTLNDREFVALTRGDQLDVLVDVNGHLGTEHYAAMASRCAPVQVVYSSYLSTTAVLNIDYILGDPWSPTPGSERTFTERIERLASSSFCFDLADAPPISEVSPAPVTRTRTITFGSFAAGMNMNATLLGWWADILNRVPDSTMFISNEEMSVADNRRALERQFAEHGIEAPRLRLKGAGSRRELIASHADVDIALDTYPYCGTLTTAEALWQGVPVITLKGPRFSSSYGASLLNGAGCRELIARTTEEYVALAVGLANDTSRLLKYRMRLRGKIIEYGLANADVFTREFEDALLAMRMRVGVTST